MLWKVVGLSMSFSHLNRSCTFYLEAFLRFQPFQGPMRCLASASGAFRFPIDCNGARVVFDGTTLLPAASRSSCCQYALVAAAVASLGDCG